MRRPRASTGSSSQPVRTDFVCPHCGVLQVVNGHGEHMGAVSIAVYSCANCGDVEVQLATYRVNGASDIAWTAYPEHGNRLAKNFTAAPQEVEAAYQDACKLLAIHTGAAGAYARRALELILDNAGYPAKSLADSITLARAEKDADKRLPKRLLQKLDYIKEIGNFALHVRRDGELTIVAISEEEVSACLETIEDLITTMFDEPVAEYHRTIALNEKLRAAGKKEIALPDLPAEYTLPVAPKPDQPQADAVAANPLKGLS